MNDISSGEVPAALQSVLEPQEQLQWWGRPKQGIMLRKSDILLIPFSCMWAGFAFFWEYEVITQKNAPFFFMLWGIPFMCLGLYITLGRFFYDAWLRSQTYYGVTTERVVIVCGQSHKIIDLAGCHELRIEKSGDGLGSIIFGSELPLYMNRSFGASSRKSPVPTLEFITDVDRVLAIIRQWQKQARAKSAD